MLQDCITADGNPRDSYLSHIISSQSPYTARGRVPSPYGLTRDSHITHPEVNTGFTPHFSPQRDSFPSTQYWGSSTHDSSPDSFSQQSRNGGYYSSRGGHSNQPPNHWSQQMHPSPSRRDMQDSGRPGTLYQSLRAHQYSPSPSMPACPDESAWHSSPTHLRRERGKKNVSGGSRSSSKLATDMRRCAPFPPARGSFPCSQMQAARDAL